MEKRGFCTILSMGRSQESPPEGWGSASLCVGTLRGLA